MSVDDLRAIDFSRLSDTLMTLLTDPTSNLKAALLLYGLLGLAVVVLLTVVVAVLMSFPDDEVDETGSEKPSSAQSSPAEEVVFDEAPAQPYRFRSAAITLGVLTAVLTVAWALTGFTTSTDAVCGACHVTTVHDAATDGQDPHDSTACVSCHEPSGMLGRYFTEVPSRLLHFAEGASGVTARAEFGQVTTSACERCHTTDIARVTVNQDTGVRMSHVEPLVASAKCLDCHVPVKGFVTQKTTGMGACLRCHDAVTASSNCSTCHDKKTAAAARSRSTSFAKPQVAELKCGGCHIQVQECDPCHGIRMPHPLAFKANGHAYAGAADFWFNDGKTCARCHTPARRSCQKCHSATLGRGHQKQWATDHQKAVPSACACHNQMAASAGRNFCQVCHPDRAVDASRQ